MCFEVASTRQSQTTFNATFGVRMRKQLPSLHSTLRREGMKKRYKLAPNCRADSYLPNEAWFWHFITDVDAVLSVVIRPYGFRTF